MDKIGQYNVRRLIGEGGMGKVYEAEEQLTGRVVALKVLRNELSRSDKGRKLFLNEMKILAHLDHRNIVRSLTSIETEGKLVLVLEHLPGDTLRQVLLDDGRMAWKEAVRVVAEVSDALASAHSHDPPVIHRDLKPDNIMVLDDGRIKVMDFGIAKIVAELTQTHTQSVGTLQYMSPEQIDARALTPRSDLYSLGLILYECLTGQPPFNSPSPRELLNLQCTAAPPEMDEDIRSALPEGLETFMLSLLEKDADDRPEDSDAVHDRLRELLGEDVTPKKRKRKPAPKAVAIMSDAPSENEDAEGVEESSSAPAEDDDNEEKPSSEKPAAAAATKTADKEDDDDEDERPLPAHAKSPLPEKKKEESSSEPPGSRAFMIVGLTFALGIILLIVIDPLGGRQDPPDIKQEPVTTTTPPTTQPLGGADVINPPGDAQGTTAEAADTQAFVPRPAGSLPATHAAPDGTTLKLIASGNFVLGSPDGVGEPDEHPQRNISLGEFLLDEREVTVSAYQQCVQQGACPRSLFSSFTSSFPSCNFDIAGRDEHPMNCISHKGAEAFCSWRSSKDSSIRYRLPSEGEWERAARFTDGRVFPWGSAKPDCTVAAVGGCGASGTSTVGSHPVDRSQEGILDLGGNVSEWVLGAYDVPLDEAKLASGEFVARNMRGGNWKESQPRRGADRDTVSVPLGDNGFGADDIGFRCVGLAR